MLDCMRLSMAPSTAGAKLASLGKSRLAAEDSQISKVFHPLQQPQFNTRL